MDVGHLNYRGARKLSSYLDDYLAGSGNLPDHRGDEKYKQWEQDLSYRYKMEEHNMMNEINDLGSLVDLAASNSDYTVIISREFEDMGGFDENFDCLRQLGMTEEEFDECFHPEKMPLIHGMIGKIQIGYFFDMFTGHVFFLKGRFAHPVPQTVCRFSAYTITFQI